MIIPMQPTTADGIWIAFYSRQWRQNLAATFATCIICFTCHLCHMVFSLQTDVPVHSAVAHAGVAALLFLAECDLVLFSFRVLCAFALFPVFLFPCALVQDAAFQFPVSHEQSRASPFLLVPGWSAGAAVSPDAHVCYFNRNKRLQI